MKKRELNEQVIGSIEYLTDPQTSLPVPCHRLDHVLQSHIVAYEVLIAGKDQNRDLFEHSRYDGDRRRRAVQTELSVNAALALLPGLRFCLRVKRCDDIWTLRDAREF